MKTIPAKLAKNGFGRFLDTVRREPVTITRNGRAVAVALSAEDYDRLKRQAARPGGGGAGVMEERTPTRV